MSDQPHGPMDGPEPGEKGYWFDQALYDAVMAEKRDALSSETYADGYDAATCVAARLSAERDAASENAGPVSDEELVRIVYAAINSRGFGSTLGALRSIIPEVRAALGPPMPVVPVGWTDDDLVRLFWEGSDRAADVTTDVEAAAGVRHVLAALAGPQPPAIPEVTQAMYDAAMAEYDRRQKKGCGHSTCLDGALTAAIAATQDA